MERDFRLAEVKRGPCRVCGAERTELVNTIGKAWQDMEQEDGSMLVVPDSVVPLCASHHRLYDAYILNILPHLTREEVANAVESVGEIRAARKRLTSEA